MPYILQEDRPNLTYSGTPRNAGDLNYLITTIIDDYVNKYGQKYAVLNEVVGALECAKLECYRRIVAPYEDKKILSNGDVYSVPVRSDYTMANTRKD